MQSHVWIGSDEPYFDRPAVDPVGRVFLGRYGGNSAAGAKHNEDGALIWTGEDWVFAAILDAHNSAQSAAIALDLLSENQPTLLAIIEAGQPGHMRALIAAVAEIFASPHGQRRLRAAQGETACLVCFQRGRYLAWLSIGDNSLYLLHPELGRLGQFTLTTRSYFEWIGQRDSLALEEPCYSSGVRELRGGVQTIALATDGLLEFGHRPYEPPTAFAAALGASPNLADSIRGMLDHAHVSGARDSATIIAWQVTSTAPGLMPTS